MNKLEIEINEDNDTGFNRPRMFVIDSQSENVSLHYKDMVMRYTELMCCYIFDKFKVKR